MSISRREMFRQLFSKRSVRRMASLPVRHLRQIVQVCSPRPEPATCEQAGLSLNASPQKSSAGMCSADVPGNLGPAHTDDTGRIQTGG